MYAKVFCQIFDSSIAEDYELRHFFMDMLVLADCNGVVDMTPTAIAARTRIPIGKVRNFITELEKPDPESRTPDFDGRRLARLDTHRTWGWVITGYARFRDTVTQRQRVEQGRLRAQAYKDRHSKSQLLDNKAITYDGFEAISGNVTQLLDNQANNAVSKKVKKTSLYSSSSSSSEGSPEGRFIKPTLAVVKLQGIKIGLPEIECEKFYDYYESKGWVVGRSRMKLWTAALANWKRNWLEYSKRDGKTVTEYPITDRRNPAHPKYGCAV